MRKLTRKQLSFVDEYLVDNNSTQAAIRAGYSKKNAGKIGPELLGKTRIDEEIKRRKTEKSKKLNITVDMWLTELWGIASSRMSHYAIINSGGGVEFIPTEDRNEGVEGAIKKITEHHSGALTIDLHNKLEALNLIAKYFGWIQDRVHHSGQIDSTHKEAQGKALSTIFSDPKLRPLALELAEGLADQMKKQGEKK